MARRVKEVNLALGARLTMPKWLRRFQGLKVAILQEVLLSVAETSPETSRRNSSLPGRSYPSPKEGVAVLAAKGSAVHFRILTSVGSRAASIAPKAKNDRPSCEDQCNRMAEGVVGATARSTLAGHAVVPLGCGALSPPVSSSNSGYSFFMQTGQRLWLNSASLWSLT